MSTELNDYESGLLCATDGQLLDGKAPGHRRYCSEECADAAEADHDLVVPEEKWADVDPHSGMPL